MNKLLRGKSRAKPVKTCLFMKLISQKIFNLSQSILSAVFTHLHISLIRTQICN